MKRIGLRWIDKLWSDQAVRGQVLDGLYLCIFSVFFVKEFVGTTMIYVPWPEYFFLFFRILAVFLIVVRYHYLEDMDIGSLLALLVITMGYIAVWQKMGDQQMFDLAILTAGAFRMNYKRILQVYLVLATAITIYTIAASQMSLVENLVYHQGERVRTAFGFVYPTDFAAHIFYMMIAWALLRQKAVTIGELLVFLAAAGWMYVYCDARCSAGCIILLVCGLGYVKLREGAAQKSGKRYRPGMFVRAVCISSPIWCAGASILASRFYDEQNTVMYLANQLLSNRLRMGKLAFDLYDVRLLGQWIELIGNGGSTEWRPDYFFIDSSYPNILLRFGLIVFCIVMFMHVALMIRKQSNVYILGMIFLICLHSVIEHHMIEFYFNPFMLAIVTDFGFGRKKE